MNKPTMSTASTAMPSSISSGSTDYHRRDSEAGPGFTAVNISPTQTRESSATSPDVSPRRNKMSDGRSPPTSAPKAGNYDQNTHKRKRSSSEDRGQQSPRRYDYHPPRKDSSQQLADRALHAMDNANQASSNSYYASTPNDSERTGHGYGRPRSAQQGVETETPEARLQEAFQKEDSGQHRYTSSINGTDHEHSEQQQHLDGLQQATNQALQKRKRNFSNRTKTGCITCRHRKKKCDENRPFCNNCQRGGFHCAGYAVTRPSTWTKPITTPKPVALQSKDNDDQADYAESPTIPANTPTVDGTQRRPIPVEGHDQRPQHTQNPTPTDSRPSYSGQHQQPQWPQHSQHNMSPQTYTPDSRPSFPEFSQTGPPRQDYHQSTPSRDMQSRPPTQSAPQGAPPVSTSSNWPSHSQSQAQAQPQPPPQYQQQPPPSLPAEYRYPPRIDTSSQSTASHPHPPGRVASSSYGSTNLDPSKSTSKVFSAEEVERSRMLRGAQYNYLDPTLRNERLRCTTALDRYTAACALTSGVSPEEAQRMLVKVFDPSLDTTHSFRARCNERGILSPGVFIEAGFRCTYGYNIRLGDNVFIGAQTRIDDSAKVSVGARTWIGPNVTILTNEVVPDMAFRKGTDGGPMNITKPVEIASEVVIGAGAVVFPGVKIGRGATVEPFAIVKQDVGDYITQKVPFGGQSGGISG